VMPSYQGLLSAAETGALVEYIRSLRDVTPALATSPLPLLAPGDDTLRLQATPERTPGLMGGLPSGALQDQPAPGAEGAQAPTPLLPVPFPTEVPERAPPAEENAP
jgi:hypothetical protein